MRKRISCTATAFLMVVCVVGSASAAYHDPDVWKPAETTVGHMDELVLAAKITSDGPLRNYTRYYWGTIRGGRRVIVGLLLAPWVETEWMGTSQSELGKVHILADESPHIIADGGCGQINVEYDVENRAITQLFCNAELPPPPPPPPDE